MSLQPIELISFNLCPFVQRSVITLKKKGIDFKVTYIELDDKPEWFLQISPLGKVPVVKYGDEVLFESAVINEFLDEITPNPIMPSDPLQKAKQRGWIEFSSQIIVNQYLLSIADNQEDFDQHSANLLDKLQRLERATSDEQYFTGANFSLVDAALAPLFTRLEIIKNHFNHNFLTELPKLTTLSQRLIQLPAVKESVIDDFEEVYVSYLKEHDSYLTK